MPQTETILPQPPARGKQKARQEGIEYYVQAVQTDPPAAISAVPRDGKKPAEFPLVGGALKCSGCGRWHNVPEEMMHAVRCPSSQQ